MEIKSPTEEAMRAINPPLHFGCFVKGKALVASVVARLDPRVTNGYRIKFSDGYVGDFYVEPWGCAEVGKEEKPSAYVFAIRKDLLSFLHFEIYKAHYCFRTKVDGVETNVYVIYHEGEDGNKYKVRYDGEYQFTLWKNSKGWSGRSECVAPGTKQPNPELVRNISLLIEAAQ